MVSRILLLLILIVPLLLTSQNQSNNLTVYPSDPCCPATMPFYNSHGCGWQYDGEKCVYDFGIDIDNFQMFFWDNKLYVNPDCDYGDANNNCCPTGFTFDGQNCYFDESLPNQCLPHIIDNEDTWLYDDIYTEDGVLYLELECCECPLNELDWDEDLEWPNGDYDEELIPLSYYNGQDCRTFIEFHPDSDYFVWNDRFYVHSDCDLYDDNNCCPTGFTFNGWNACYYEGPYVSGFDPSGEDWFVWDGALYFEPGNCCPDAIHTKNDICAFMDTSADDNAHNAANTFTMINDGFINLSFTTYCVRDRIIITVNGNVVVDSGNFSSDACGFGQCNSSLLQPCGNDTFGCGLPFTANFSWNTCDEINVQFLGNTCSGDGSNTVYSITCD